MKQNYAKIISGFILAGLLTFSSCQSTHEMAKTDYQIAKVEGRMIDIDAKWDTHPDADAVAILKPYKEKIDNMMYEVIGSSEQKMDKGHPESLLSNLVAEVLRQAATKVQDKPADMGLVNMGGLRNILPAGDITVGTVYEILPFENSLCVMKMKGTHLKALLTSIASLLNATVGGQPIDDNKLYTVATIDYLADGNGSMEAFLQADDRVCPEGATLRGLFLDYVRQQTAAGKKITSALDGRITVK